MTAQHVAETFDPAQWLARWQAAGGSFALIGDRPLITRMVGASPELDAIEREVIEQDRREQLRDHLASVERARMGEA